MNLSKAAVEHRDAHAKTFAALDHATLEQAYTFGFNEAYAFARKEMEAEIQRLNDLLWKYQEPGKLTIKEFE